MSLFEFLMVLVSIIVGLGVAEVLTGVARLSRSRGSSTRYWIHSCIVALVFFALIQQWWELWTLRDVPEWTFLSLILMLTGPMGLFLIAHLIFPESLKGADLKDHYYDSIRPIGWLAALTVFFTALFRPLAFGFQLLELSNATSLIFLAGFIALSTSRNSTLHAVLVPLFLVLLLWDIVQWNPTIGFAG